MNHFHKKNVVLSLTLQLPLALAVLSSVSVAKFDLPTLWHPKHRYLLLPAIRHLYSPLETTETRLKEFPCICFDRESAIFNPGSMSSQLVGRLKPIHDFPQCIFIQIQTHSQKCSKSETPTNPSIAMLKAKVSGMTFSPPSDEEIQALEGDDAASSSCLWAGVVWVFTVNMFGLRCCWCHCWYENSPTSATEYFPLNGAEC